MKVAFYLSGEHPSLPKAEIKAVLESLDVRFTIHLDLESLLVLELDELSNSLIKRMADRLAYTRSIGRLIAVLKPSNFPSGLKKIRPPKVGRRFRATAIRVRGCCREMKRVEVEREVGGWILGGNPHAKVDLTHPESKIVVVMTSGMLVIYDKRVEVDRTSFKIKEVAARPFVHPASMRPTLARAMVNLARTREGDLVLDPFLGVGGIALEALSIGARLIGADISEKRVIEAKNNLIAYGFLEGFELIVGDALSLELGEKVDRIVTDPPYGRMSPAVGRSPEGLVRDFLWRAPTYLKGGGWMVISVPKDHLNEKDFRESGFDVVEYFDLREHRSLTRRIWVTRLRE